MMTWEDHLALATPPPAHPMSARIAALQSQLKVKAPAGVKPSTLKVTPANTYPTTPRPRDVALANTIGRNLQQAFSQNGGAVPRNTADPHNLLTSA